MVSSYRVEYPWPGNKQQVRQCCQSLAFQMWSKYGKYSLQEHAKKYWLSNPLKKYNVQIFR